MPVPSLTPHTLTGWQAHALLLCDDTAHTADRVHAEPDDPATSIEEVRRFLDHMATTGTCVEEDGKYLSLALPAR